ncbi:hypothetical protein RIF29_37304 [Crotalaria pallida]|uniref:Cold shock protein n=1 Tax=Crotalaria pallida TaxID=3830 RepID=A0AAN9ECJ3_CROPI
MAEEQRFKGVVKRFHDARGFGFILPDDGGEEVFVHHSAIVSDGYRTLAVGDEVEFSIRKADNGNYQAFDVVGPNALTLRSDGCFKCGGSGHMARNCNQKANAGGGGSAKCYNCGGLGHMIRDCPKERGNGGGRACYKCGEIGHMAKDCDNGEMEWPVAGKCFNCGEQGHYAKNCSNRSGGSSDVGKQHCFNCGKPGHFARDCSQASR